MDLDKMKNAWQEADIKPNVRDEKIKQMLENRGQWAFGRLLSIEKIGVICVFICIPLWIGIFLLDKYLDNISIFSIFMLVSLTLVSVWQIMKYRFLRKIDVTKGLVLVSSQIVRYKKLLSTELIIAVVWVLVAAALFVYNKVLMTKDISLPDITASQLLFALLFYVLFCGVTFFITWVIYKAYFVGNIKWIEQSIAEIREFEKGESETENNDNNNQQN